MPPKFLILSPRRRSDPELEKILLENLKPFGTLTKTGDWVSLFSYATITKYAAIFISCSAFADEHEQWLKDINRLHPHQAIILFSANADFDVRIIQETSRIFGLLQMSRIESSLPLLMSQLNQYLKLKSDLKSKVSKALLRPGGFGEFVGNSSEMLSVYRQLTRIAVSDYTVLIQGESGSGKELVAKTIHLLSERRDQPFISINCAAIPENLLESELFGYEKGAFTGATHTKAGKFELAHRGTLFLDEIGDMPLELQVKLLRVLENGLIQPLGGVREKEVNIRLVTATHRDLPTQINEGLFREDLHYRLNVIPLKLPPLRSRSSDLGLLILYFLKKLLRGDDQPIRRVSWNLLFTLESLRLQGNVRELENLLTRSVFQSEGHVLNDKALLRSEETLSSDSISDKLRNAEQDQIKPLWQIEKEALINALEILNGNISQVAAQLEISRAAIYRKIKKYDLPVVASDQDQRGDHA